MMDPPANETLNCKDIDNYQCADLSTVLQVSYEDERTLLTNIK